MQYLLVQSDIFDWNHLYIIMIERSIQLINYAVICRIRFEYLNVIATLTFRMIPKFDNYHKNNRESPTNHRLHEIHKWYKWWKETKVIWNLILVLRNRDIKPGTTEQLRLPHQLNGIRSNSSFHTNTNSSWSWTIESVHHSWSVCHFVNHLSAANLM